MSTEPEKGTSPEKGTEPPEKGTEPPEKDDPEYEIKRWKAMARKSEEQAKDALEKLRKHEDAGKSELEKATARAEQESKRAEEAERKALRLEVATDKGLTAGQAKRLVGSTREELEADADELLSSFKGEGGGSEKDPTRPGGRPKEKLRPGAVPDAETEETDPRKLAESIPRR